MGELDEFDSGGMETLDEGVVEDVQIDSLMDEAGFEEIEPPFEEMEPPLEEMEPPVEEIEPPFEEMEPPPEEMEPSLEEMEPPPEDLSAEELLAEDIPEMEEMEDIQDELPGGMEETPVPTALDNMTAYMSEHNYGQGDYPEYSQDPEWQALNQELQIANGIEPTDYGESGSALDNMSAYMNEHNYGQGDYPEYSQDPEWQALNQELQIADGIEPTDYGDSSLPEMDENVDLAEEGTAEITEDESDVSALMDAYGEEEALTELEETAEAEADTPEIEEGTPEIEDDIPEVEAESESAEFTEESGDIAEETEETAGEAVEETAEETAEEAGEDLEETGTESETAEFTEESEDIAEETEETAGEAGEDLEETETESETAEFAEESGDIAEETEETAGEDMEETAEETAEEAGEDLEETGTESETAEFAEESGETAEEVEETAEAEEETEETAEETEGEVSEETEITAETIDCFQDTERVDDILTDFQEGNWENLTVEEQKESIDQLYDYVTEVLHLENPPRLEYYNNPQEGDYAYVTGDGETMAINEYCLWNSEEAADTVAHELWHAYQHQRAANPRTELDYQYAENFENYIPAELDFNAYQDQLVEADARNFAQRFKDYIKNMKK